MNIIWLNPYKGNGSYFNSDGTVNINGDRKTDDPYWADMKWLQAMFDAGYKFYPNQAIGKDKIWYGDMIYADYNGDGIYGNDDDRDFQGVSWRPKYYFGLQASMTWKGFDLSMNWAGAAGFKIDYYKQTQNSVSVTHGYGLGYDIAYDHYFFDPEIRMIRVRTFIPKRHVSLVIRTAVRQVLPVLGIWRMVTT